MDIDVTEHEWLSNITLTQNQVYHPVKWIFIAVNSNNTKDI
jgi:hypothetical protein